MRISDWSSDVCSSDLESGGFENVATSVLPCYGKLVCTHRIQDFKSSARRKRIRAEHGNALIGDKHFETLLVFAQVFPKLLCNPGRNTVPSPARVTSGRYPSAFPQPNRSHPHNLKPT